MLQQNAFSLIETDQFKSSDETIKKAFKAFLEKPESYRNEFLQTHYNRAFDGYSYLGQKDSLNQYDIDLLHSFVLSEYSSKDEFPKEFYIFLNNDWNRLISRIKRIELDIIMELNIPELNKFYNAHIGHMVSCNYYPAIEKKHAEDMRLSKHIDVSLFTVFVFGLTEGFAYQDSLNKKQLLKSVDNIVVFPGYLLEFLTQGKYKALEHQVDFTQSNTERFSFAFFSIPKPLSNVQFGNLQFTSESYFESYVSLF
jgi:hypothetical protein